MFAKIFRELTRYHPPKCTLVQIVNICRRQLNPSRKKVFVFTCVQYTSFENTVGKGEIARHEQFFYRFGELSAIFIKF